MRRDDERDEDGGRQRSRRWRAGSDKDRDKDQDKDRLPNETQYPHQEVMVIKINDYAYAVPFVERGQERFLKTIVPKIGKHQGYARNTLRKDKRVNIRISSRDLEALQARAVENGLPYQTLMASVLHRYVTGCLREA